MKRTIIALLFVPLLMLCGCAATQTVWETVDDVLPVMAAEKSEAYAMSFDVPLDALLGEISESGARRVYVCSDGGYEISAETFEAESIDAAVRRLSGFSAEQLQLVRTRRFGMAEYQFAWYATGDEGGRVYRADVLMDGTYGYALVFSVKEGTGADYADTAEQVFSSFNLFYDEQV